MTQRKENRILYIDLARGLTMLTILWGHVMLTGAVNLVVYAFHIPVFFFLSGMVFKKEKYPTFGSFVKRRVRTLLIPYVIYSGITWVWWLLDCLSKGYSLAGCWHPFMQTFLAQGSAGYLLHNPALWFVTCLFVVEVLYYFLCKLPNWGNLLASAFFAAIGWLMMQPNEFFDFKTLPWNVEVALAAVLFYAMGNLFAKSADHKKLVQTAMANPLKIWILTVVSFVVLCIGGVKNGHVTMAQGALGDNVVLFYLIAICGIIFMLSLCVALSAMHGRGMFGDKILNYFAWMGRNSFYMMVLHIPVMLAAVRVVSIIMGVSLDDVRVEYIYTVPAWIGMVVGSSLLTWLIELGKKKWAKRKI